MGADGTSALRQTPVKWLWAGSVVVLCPVAGIGAVLSFTSLREGAEPVFGDLAVGFPLLGDMLILGSTLAYLAGALAGRPLPGWRWTAHSGVGVTLVLNAMAASDLRTVPWHVTPALVWSVLVEMTARQVTGHWKDPASVAPESISVRLWVSHPFTTTQIWLQMARTGERRYPQAGARHGIEKAAIHVLKEAMPRRKQRRERRLLQAQLRSGTLDPHSVLSYLQTDGDGPRRPGAAIQALVGPQSGTAAYHRPQKGAAGRPAHLERSSLAGAPRTRALTPTAPSGHPEASDVITEADDRRGRGQAPAQTRSTSDLRRLRAGSVSEILQEKPDIDGRELVNELRERGWNVSYRTARRLLAVVHRDVRASD